MDDLGVPSVTVCFWFLQAIHRRILLASLIDMVWILTCTCSENGI